MLKWYHFETTLKEELTQYLNKCGFLYDVVGGPFMWHFAIHTDKINAKIISIWLNERGDAQ